MSKKLKNDVHKYILKLQIILLEEEEHTQKASTAKNIFKQIDGIIKNRQIEKAEKSDKYYHGITGKDVEILNNLFTDLKKLKEKNTLPLVEDDKLDEKLKEVVLSKIAAFEKQVAELEKTQNNALAPILVKAKQNIGILNTAYKEHISDISYKKLDNYESIIATTNLIKSTYANFENEVAQALRAQAAAVKPEEKQEEEQKDDEIKTVQDKQAEEASASSTAENAALGLENASTDEAKQIAETLNSIDESEEKKTQAQLETPDLGNNQNIDVQKEVEDIINDALPDEQSQGHQENHQDEEELMTLDNNKVETKDTENEENQALEQNQPQDEEEKSNKLLDELLQQLEKPEDKTEENKTEVVQNPSQSIDQTFAEKLKIFNEQQENFGVALGECQERNTQLANELSTITAELESNPTDERRHELEKQEEDILNEQRNTARSILNLKQAIQAGIQQYCSDQDVYLSEKIERLTTDLQQLSLTIKDDAQVIPNEITDKQNELEEARKQQHIFKESKRGAMESLEKIAEEIKNLQAKLSNEESGLSNEQIILLKKALIELGKEPLTKATAQSAARIVRNFIYEELPGRLSYDVEGLDNDQLNNADRTKGAVDYLNTVLTRPEPNANDICDAINQLCEAAKIDETNSEELQKIADAILQKNAVESVNDSDTDHEEEDDEEQDENIEEENEKAKLRADVKEHEDKLNEAILDRKKIKDELTTLLKPKVAKRNRQNKNEPDEAYNARLDEIAAEIIKEDYKEIERITLFDNDEEHIHNLKNQFDKASKEVAVLRDQYNQAAAKLEEDKPVEKNDKLDKHIDSLKTQPNPKDWLKSLKERQFTYEKLEEQYLARRNKLQTDSPEDKYAQSEIPKINEALVALRKAIAANDEQIRLCEQLGDKPFDEAALNAERKRVTAHEEFDKKFKEAKKAAQLTNQAKAIEADAKDKINRFGGPAKSLVHYERFATQYWANLELIQKSLTGKPEDRTYYLNRCDQLKIHLDILNREFMKQIQTFNTDIKMLEQNNSFDKAEIKYKAIDEIKTKIDTVNWILKETDEVIKNTAEDSQDIAYFGDTHAMLKADNEQDLKKAYQEEVKKILGPSFIINEAPPSMGGRELEIIKASERFNGVTEMRVQSYEFKGRDLEEGKPSFRIAVGEIVKGRNCVQEFHLPKEIEGLGLEGQLRFFALTIRTQLLRKGPPIYINGPWSKKSTEMAIVVCHINKAASKNRVNGLEDITIDNVDPKMKAEVEAIIKDPARMQALFGEDAANIFVPQTEIQRREREFGLHKQIAPLPPEDIAKHSPHMRR